MTLHAKVDYECNAEVWWDSFRHALAEVDDLGPGLAYACSVLEGEGSVEIADPWTIKGFVALVTNLPGWADPSHPAHAPHPLVLRDGRGNRWNVKRGKGVRGA